MLRALAEAGVRPDLVVGTSIGALNGVLVAADPAGAADRLARMWQGEELRLAFSEKLFGRAARLARSGTHLHSLEPLRRMLAGLLPGAWLFRSRVAVPVRGGQHRGGHRALVLLRAGGPGGDGLVRRARAAAAGGDRRGALLRRRAGRLDPGRASGRARRLHGLRAPGGPDRERAGGAAAAVGGGPGRVRDRTAAPVPRGDVVAAGRRSGSTCCRPAGTGSRPAGRSSATGTGPGSGSASSARTPRPRATSPRSPPTEPVRASRPGPPTPAYVGFRPFLSVYRIAPLRWGHARP